MTTASGARLEMYRVLTAEALSEPFGQGLNNQDVLHGLAIDSGILIAVFSMGWLGRAMFGAGILSLFLHRKGPGRDDEFLRVGKAAMIAMLAQIVGGNVFVSIVGVMFWSMAGMCLAGQRRACALRNGLQTSA